MLTLDRVTKTYKVGSFGGSELRAVREVSFSVAPGEVVALIGESGSGKSTIGKMILRLLEINGGTIRFEDTDVGKLTGSALREYYRRVQGVFQDPFSSFNPVFKVSHVFDLVRNSYFGDASKAAWQARVSAAMDTVNLEPGQVLYKYPHQLSGGQLQRLLIARALLLDTQFLVADEIISMLDASTRIDVLNLLGDLRERGLGILFITHDLSLGNYISARAIILRRGRIAEMGPTAEVFGAPLHPYTRMLLASVPQLHAKWGALGAEERAGAGWAPSASEPCLYHALATPGPVAGLAEVGPGHFVGCVNPLDDGSCGRSASPVS